MRIIGITGGIGSGKSTVTEYLRSNGYEVFDADAIAREIVAPGFPAYADIIKAFGTVILQEDGTIDRKKLGELIFHSTENKKQLDSIMHTRIIETVSDEIQNASGPLVFVDAALLFETNMDRDMDEVWLIDVTLETQLKRVMERDNLTREAALSRITSQMSREERRKRADFIILNEKDTVALYRKIAQRIDEINGRE